MTIVCCNLCSKKFYAKPNHIKKGWGKYCSLKCLYDKMKTGSNVCCNVCNKVMYRTSQDIKRSKSGNFYCSKKCFAQWKNSHVLLGTSNGNWKNGQNAYRAIMIRSGTVPKCSDCGISNLRVLVVHHVNRNRDNNHISNLKWLCRNCHYLEHKGKTL